MDTDTIQLRDLYIATPLIKSEPLTNLLRHTTTTTGNSATTQRPRDVYIKLDNLQRSGSYKDRGMAHLLYTKRFGKRATTTTDDTASNGTNSENSSTTTTNNTITQIVCSSGGNAGLAAATVARDLQLPCTVVVPITTKTIVIDKLKSLDATVIVTGTNWNEADAVAQTIVSDDTNNSTLYVPPYDHPLLWTGISTIIDEIYTDESYLNSHKGNPPSSIIVSVGGGGLLCGILEGLQNYNTKNNSNSPDATSRHMPHIICSETEGAASFNASYSAQTIVPLTEITSIATSLGALSITPHALQRAQQYSGIISSTLCTDAEAVQACLNFARDHRMLVEPACGAALAVLYSDRLREQYFSSSSLVFQSDGPIVIEICGGSGITIDLLNEWERQLLLVPK